VKKLPLFPRLAGGNGHLTRLGKILFFRQQKSWKPLQSCILPSTNSDYLKFYCAELRQSLAHYGAQEQNSADFSEWRVIRNPCLTKSLKLAMLKSYRFCAARFEGEVT